MARLYQSRTRPSGQGLGYLSGATPELRGATQAFEQLGLNVVQREEQRRARGQQITSQQIAERQRELERQEKESEQRRKQLQNFRALQDLTAFESNLDARLMELKQGAQPDDPEFEGKVLSMFEEEKAKFLERVPTELQPEFAYRADVTGSAIHGNARKFQFDTQNEYFRKGVDDLANKAKVSLQANPSKENMALWKSRVGEMIDAADVPQVLKTEWKRLADVDLSKIMMAYDLENGNLSRANPEGKVLPGSQADIMIKAAGELGVDPVDLATAISYETGGKFSTSVWGGKGGGYLGLIQFGAWEREKYGVKPGQSFEEQMEAVKAFLKDRGLKPGMTLMDIYSTINAGSPGRYSASDGPGQTVARHVVAMNQTHRAKAQAIIEGKLLLDGIDFDPDYANIPYEDRLALRRDAETKANHADTELAKAAERERQGRVSDLFIGLSNGTKGRADIDQAQEEGWLTDFQGLDRADRILEKREKEGAALRDMQALLSTPHGVVNPANEHHRDGLNAMVGAEGLAAVQKLDQGYVDQAVIPLVTRANDVPTELAGTLVGMSRSNEPSQQLFALDALARIQDASPAAFNQRFDGTVASDVAMYQEGKRLSGLPVGDQPSDGMKVMLAKIRGGITQEERQSNEVLRSEAKRLLTSRTDPNFVNFEDVYGNRFWGRDPEIPAVPHARNAMRGDFEALFIDEWARGGDKEAVVERVLTRMDKVWGPTDIGGRTYWMRLPPNKAGYKAFEGSHKYIDEAVRREREIGTDEQFELISDDRTMWEHQQFQRGSGAPPSYKVVKLNAAGAWEALPGRQTVDYTADMEKREIDGFAVRQEEARLGEWLAGVYAPAIEHSTSLGIPLPEDLMLERQQREELVKEMRKRYEAGQPVTSRP